MGLDFREAQHLGDTLKEIYEISTSLAASRMRVLSSSLQKQVPSTAVAGKIPGVREERRW